MAFNRAVHLGEMSCFGTVLGVGELAPVREKGLKMAAKKKQNKRDIESYEHTDKSRSNNPPVGLVTPDTDPDTGKKTYSYDPHLDPQLQWAGKAEHTSFEVPTLSLHVHERIVRHWVGPT